MIENSLEEWARRMPQAERLARIEELRAKARDVYLPLYEQQQQNRPVGGRPIINWTTAAPTVAVNDNDNAGDERKPHSPGDLTVAAPAGG